MLAPLGVMAGEVVADDVVVAEVAVQMVAADSPDRVPAAGVVADDEVVGEAAVDLVVARPADQRRGLVSVEPVRLVAAEEAIGPAAAADDVAPPLPRILSLPPMPAITSAWGVPLMWLPRWLPTIVALCPKQLGRARRSRRSPGSRSREPERRSGPGAPAIRARDGGRPSITDWRVPRCLHSHWRDHTEVIGSPRTSVHARRHVAGFRASATAADRE